MYERGISRPTRWFSLRSASHGRRGAGAGCPRGGRPPRHSSDEIEAIRVEYLGRKSELKLALREVRDRDTGIRLNAVRERSRRRWPTGRTSSRGASSTDGSGGARRRHAPRRPAPRGRLHLITQIRREVEDVFLGLGYRVFDGHEVDTVFYNFDGLNFPAGAPVARPAARDASSSTTRPCSAPHTSPTQIRTMQAQEPPIYIVSLGRVYRRDTPDATHTPTFHQVECARRRRRITLGDLRGGRWTSAKRPVRSGARGAR